MTRSNWLCLISNVISTLTLLVRRTNLDKCSLLFKAKSGKKIWLTPLRVTDTTPWRRWKTHNRAQEGRATEFPQLRNSGMERKMAKGLLTGRLSLNNLRRMMPKLYSIHKNKALIFWMQMKKNGPRHWHQMLTHWISSKKPMMASTKAQLMWTLTLEIFLEINHRTFSNLHVTHRDT